MNADLLKTILEKHLLFLQAKGGEKANLREANLRGANLRGADLREADLRGAGIKFFQAGLWTAIISSDFISIGCQRHSAEKWLNFTDEEISAMNPFALDYWNENRDIVFAISQSIDKVDRCRLETTTRLEIK